MSDSRANIFRHGPTTQPKHNKSCDECRARKVKCPNPGGPAPCATCVRRKTTCYFGPRRPPRRRNVNEAFHSPGTSPIEAGTTSALPVISLVNDSDITSDKIPEKSGSSKTTCIPELYVDQLLSRAQSPETPESEKGVIIEGNGIIGAYNITFFSDARLLSLSNRLGNNSVHELVSRISAVVRTRFSKRPDSGQHPSHNAAARFSPTNFFTDRVAAQKYIELYFERLHPTLPFLDRTLFEKTALGSNLDATLSSSKPWVCLYHAVLALGSRYGGEGSFEPGGGKSWGIFSVALTNFPDLILQHDSLPALQAMTAMAIFSLSSSCLAIEHVIISEATRRAQNLAGASFANHTAQLYQRSFWVLYTIEKISSFQIGRSSLFVDADISTPLPSAPEANFAGFDYLLCLIRYARIVSKALTSLFCVGVANKPTAYHLEVTTQLNAELEEWRLSLPDNGYRPNGDVRPETIEGLMQRQNALFVQCLYANMSLIINRNILLHLTQRSDDGSFLPRRQAAVAAVRKSCRLILELTVLIDVEPHTNIWMLATIPLSALFVLFDIVINNPRQPDTYSNLALLDMAAGHFSRLEYRSNGTLPGSLISEFSYIARNYVNSIHSRGATNKNIENREATTGVTHRTAQNNAGGSASRNVSGMSSILEEAAQPREVSQPYRVLGLEEGNSGVPFELERFGEMESYLDSLAGALPSDTSLGTNVLDLFSNFLPDLDPMLYEGTPGGVDVAMPLDEHQ